MIPALLLPGALAALAALLLPIAIHLARRSEQRPTDFAALRWLRQKPKPRHRIRFDEWPLLLVRLLLLALVALWLARPVLPAAVATRPWLVVMPGADPGAVPADVEARWLAPGYPAIDRPALGGPVPFASLLRQLDATLPPATRLTVIVPAVLQGADAERPRLSRAVDWRIVAGAMPAAAAPVRPETLVVRAPASAAGVRFVRAAALASRPAWGVAAADPAEPVPADAKSLVWLVPGPLPRALTAWIAAGGTALVAAETEVPADPRTTPYWRDAVGRPLVEGAPLGRGRLLRFVRPLTPAAMPELVDPDFPRRLRALIVTVATPTRVAAADHAPLRGGGPWPQPARDLRPWLALLIAGVLLAERWLATRRRRALAP